MRKYAINAVCLRHTAMTDSRLLHCSWPGIRAHLRDRSQNQSRDIVMLLPDGISHEFRDLMAQSLVRNARILDTRWYASRVILQCSSSVTAPVLFYAQLCAFCRCELGFIPKASGDGAHRLYLEQPSHCLPFDLAQATHRLLVAVEVSIAQLRFSNAYADRICSVRKILLAKRPCPTLRICQLRPVASH